MARTRKALPAKVEVAHLIGAGVLAGACPRALIEEALVPAVKAGQRERLLPAPAVVYDPMTLGLAAPYHERGKIEDVFDEIKTHRWANSTALRSKTPELVLQEPWGLLLAPFAIRRLLARAAWPGELDPDRLRFTHAVRVIKGKMPQASAAP